MIPYEKLVYLARKPRMFNKDMDVNQNVYSIYNLCRDFLKKRSRIVEIGSYSGGATEIFALFCKKVFAVDCWNDNLNVKQDGRYNLKLAERLFDLKIKKYSNIIKIRKLSCEAVKDISDLSMDCVYIDGDHRLSGIIHDIVIWYPKVKVKGIIAGHDYNDKNIRMIINELLGIPKTVYADSSWVFRKKYKALRVHE